MLATDGLALLREHYEQNSGELRLPASIVTIRRR
jgi:hypothetical protein